MTDLKAVHKQWKQSNQVKIRDITVLLRKTPPDG
jgi:hypothetical protein